MIEVGGPIDLVRVTLRVFGEDLEPKDVTALLGVQPTDSLRLGEVREGSSAPPAKDGRWLYSVESSDQLDVVIRQLLMRLDGSPEVWERLHARFEVDLYCGLFMEEWSRGFGLSPETLAAVSQRALPVEFDIYAVGEADAG